MGIFDWNFLNAVNVYILMLKNNLSLWYYFFSQIQYLGSSSTGVIPATPTPQAPYRQLAMDPDGAEDKDIKDLRTARIKNLEELRQRRDVAAQNLSNLFSSPNFTEALASAMMRHLNGLNEMIKNITSWLENPNPPPPSSLVWCSLLRSGCFFFGLKNIFVEFNWGR